MPYADLPSKSSGSVFDLATYMQIRENFDVGVPDIIAAKGDLVVGIGPDAVARLPAGANNMHLITDSSQTTGTRWQLNPQVKVFRNSEFDPATGAFVDIPWPSEVYDTDAMHSTGTNPERLIWVSGGTGVWVVKANVGLKVSDLDPGTSGDYDVKIVKNGSTQVVVGSGPNERNGRDIWINVSSHVQMSNGDYLTCQVFTSRNINVLTDSWFSMSFVRNV